MKMSLFKIKQNNRSLNRCFDTSSVFIITSWLLKCLHVCVNKQVLFPYFSIGVVEIFKKRFVFISFVLKKVLCLLWGFDWSGSVFFGILLWFAFNEITIFNTIFNVQVVPIWFSLFESIYNYLTLERNRI